jgi:hypothetical protein
MAKAKSRQQQFEEASSSFLRSSEYLDAKSKNDEAASAMYEQWKSSYKFDQAYDNFARWVLTPPPWIKLEHSFIVSLATGSALAISNSKFILWLWHGIPQDSPLPLFILRNIPAFIITAIAIYVVGYIVSTIFINLFKYILALVVIAAVSIVFIHFKTHDYSKSNSRQPGTQIYK